MSRDAYRFIEQIERSFTHHPPKDGQSERHEAIRANAKDLALLIESICPDSRERQKAINKIDEGVMWADASIARNE